MPIKDVFAYSGRWDMVGLDCAYCTYQLNGENWPNIDRDYGCGLHNRLLTVELNARGYKNGEWFCKFFNDNGSASPNAVKTFKSFMGQLKADILYGCYGEDEFLKEISLDKLPKLEK